MTTHRLCPVCRQPLGADTPEGLCPACLLRSDAPTLAHDDPPRPAQALPVKPVPGQLLGSYRILRLLGRGGMGEVFEAEQSTTGRRVALKIMSHALTSETDRKRFLREGRLAAAVNHPNVVYVHGSEEIASAPVIAMELVRGGTLKDRIERDGPLPVTEAIEAALQIIDGLEAAHVAGVLHRDVKPANCFVSSDGTVKIGDFGLSVSTIARGESLLTATGAVLGTPAYASPEQLRGQELAVTSDIYALAATLYHLLTGRPPFVGQDFVKLITEVLDKAPAAPHTLRPGIPPELSRAVLRGLAKEPQARFQSYAEFRQALLPFRDLPAEPARPGRRLLAGLVDDILVAGLPVWVLAIHHGLDPLEQWVRQRSLSAALLWLGCFLWGILYYSICEGIWGAGVGKRWCGLRVVGPDRQLPGCRRAAARALLFQVPAVVPALVFMAWVSADRMQVFLMTQGALPSDWAGLLLLIGWFLPMRARNGFAAVHDRLSGTRVVRRAQLPEPRPSYQAIRTQVPNAPEPGFGTPATSPPAGAAAPLGPYLRQRLLRQETNAALWLGVDPVLNRPVWLWIRPADTPPVPPRRQDLSRATRLRWLNGGTSAEGRWDAFEAAAGAPVLALTAPVGWNTVRFWLWDLATELAHPANGPLTAPELSLDRLWVTAAGRLVVLDFACPGLTPREAGADAAGADDEIAGQRFLDLLAARALEGPADGSRTSPGTPPAAPVPLHARQFLETLARQGFDTLRFVAGNLGSLLTKPAEITRARRAASLLLAPAVLATLGLLLTMLIHFDNLRQERAWASAYPGRLPLRAASQAYLVAFAKHAEQPEGQNDLQQRRVYLRANYSDVITNEVFWGNENLGGEFSQFERELLRQIVATQPLPQPDAIEEINRRIGPEVEAIARDQWVDLWGIVVGAVCFGLALMAVVDFQSAARGRPGLLLRALGMAVVDRRGQPARAGRLHWRWLLTWIPLGTASVSGGYFPVLSDLVKSLAYPVVGVIQPSAGWLVVFVASALVVAAGLVTALVTPGRGLQDRLAGTWLVRK